MQIVVLGAHRSGTSALTRLVNMMGAYAGSEGSTIGFNPENPKGFWERRDVINLNDAILAHLNCRWDDLYHWQFLTRDHFTREALTPELHESIKSIVLELDHHRPWVMKDPRLCETFGFWRMQMEVPAAIVGWRDPLEVAISLHTRNGLSILHGLALWEHATLSALHACADIPYIFVSYAELMEQPVAAVKRLHDWTQEAGIQGLRLPTEAEIAGFIDPALYRSKATDDTYRSLLSPQQEALLQMLQRGRIGDLPSGLGAVAADTLQMAHQQRVAREELEATHQASQAQADRIRDLEQVIDLYENQAWSLQQAEWEQARQQLNVLQQQLADQQQLLHQRIDLLGDPGRIRRRLARILSAIA